MSIPQTPSPKKHPGRVVLDGETLTPFVLVQLGKHTYTKYYT